MRTVISKTRHLSLETLISKLKLPNLVSSELLLSYFHCLFNCKIPPVAVIFARRRVEQVVLSLDLLQWFLWESFLLLCFLSGVKEMLQSCSTAGVWVGFLFGVFFQFRLAIISMHILKLTNIS